MLYVISHTFPEAWRERGAYNSEGGSRPTQIPGGRFRHCYRMMPIDRKSA